ncbi:isochorismate synthase [Umezawaea beigongshangensis]|uniref:isochorismate synthase n=1 Tax=Umezawaea beigongshangensis TaxID=2780383 RepID=UPI001E5BC536|nr:isochorismate synthase [Umezawaea beigongshangensis]
MPSVRTPERELGSALLRDHRPESFLLSSPNGVVLAPDPVHDLLSEDAARAALATASGDDVLVGAFPFDLDQPARLALSSTVRHGAPVAAEAFSPPPASGAIRWSRGAEDVGEYRSAVAGALRRMELGGLDKVVLARAIELTGDRAVRPAELVAALAAGDPRAYVYSIDLGDRTLVGASPELLVSQRDGTVLANPLAGSAPRHPDPVRDGQNATALLYSAKDQGEHRMVVDAVADGLAPLCRQLTVPQRPELLRTGTMWHLSSRVTGVPRDGVTALDLALALHPTPAVCGLPTAAAGRLIRELEPFDRGFYAGMVGWTDARGNGEWAVTIRCVELRDRSLRLFAGAGVVPESTPDGEVAETAAKFRAVLRALNIEEDHR